MDNVDNVVMEIQKIYPYIPIEVLKYMSNNAVSILLDTLYPFDDTKTIKDIPNRKENWVSRCVVEQIERKGFTSAIGYSENGINFKFDRAQISQGLIDEITPKGGVW